ncbi:DUF2813 domain-containing protein [Pseudaeromonas sharmana]|uniref:DUF2813 domain-containing protein n=1 Tax=Pseudaeromonas sharmana TaxID=328412 RepID=A0ABV8CPE3_9GAMM
MFLERIEVLGFRGIHRLSVTFQQTTALIGENTWGKTSLLRALWSLLGQGETPYEFEIADFHCPDDPELPIARHLQLILTFREYKPDICVHSSRLCRLKPIWCKGRDGVHRIYYRAAADWLADDNVASEHGFLDQFGRTLQLDDTDKLLHLLMLMNPVLRLRDTRSARDTSGSLGEEWASQLAQVSRQILDEEATGLDAPTLQQGMAAIHHLMSHYLSNVPPIRMRPRSARDIVTKPTNLRGLNSLQELLHSANGRAVKLAMAALGGALLNARGDREIDPESRPILILEDPESRLHPTMLALAWGLFEQLPGQKILTTNSGDLLSTIPLGQIRRLVRRAHETLAFNLNDEQFSAEDLRRIAFHVRLNRPMSLFARCWLLVEGETEIWLLSELAAICGYSLRSEGVRIIEFAQCGVSPLIKAARDLGIEWHLLADGDPAGMKYAASVRSHLKGEREKDRLTLLPAHDIEHFLFHHGFEEVYRREAGMSRQLPSLPAGKIIERAINHRSKPALALCVVEAAERAGAENMPLLLRQLFARVIGLARQQG